MVKKKCDVCGKSFSTDCAYVRHIRRKNPCKANDQTITCNKCGMRFTRKTNLTRHINSKRCSGVSGKYDLSDKNTTDGDIIDNHITDKDVSNKNIDHNGIIDNEIGKTDIDKTDPSTTKTVMMCDNIKQDIYIRTPPTKTEQLYQRFSYGPQNNGKNQSNITQDTTELDLKHDIKIFMENEPPVTPQSILQNYIRDNIPFMHKIITRLVPYSYTKEDIEYIMTYFGYA